MVDWLYNVRCFIVSCATITAPPFTFINRCLWEIYVYKVNWKNTSSNNWHLMKFRYVESQKPTRNDCSWVNSIVETGINITYVSRHFDIHKNTCLPKHQWFLVNRVGCRSPEIGQIRKNLTPFEEHCIYMYITSRLEIFLPANPPFSTSRNCLLYARIRRNRLEPSPIQVEDGQNIDVLSFPKHFHDRQSAPYKWNKTSVARTHCHFINRKKSY